MDDITLVLSYERRMKYVVAALYHFFDFLDCAGKRESIKAELLKHGIKGTLLITPEGINGTIAGTREAIDHTIAYLQREITREPFEYKESLCDFEPFKRTKVKVKKETISIGEPTPLDKRGQYVDAQEWNRLISEPETIVIDTRNNYEVELGTFERAMNPGILHFKQLPAYVREQLADKKHTKIASFCTGGIRCEKFTAWLASEGYEQVYHLKGGILKYIEEMPQAQSKWQGKCFVFDERIAVDHRLAPLQAMPEE